MAFSPNDLRILREKCRKPAWHLDLFFKPFLKGAENGTSASRRKFAHNSEGEEMSSLRFTQGRLLSVAKDLIFAYIPDAKMVAYLCPTALARYME